MSNTKKTNTQSTTSAIFPPKIESGIISPNSTTSSSVFLKLSPEHLSSFLLNVGNDRQWGLKANQRWFKTNITFLTGGCVYKKIAGDNTNDVDVVTNNVKALGKILLKTYEGAYHPSLEYNGVDITKVIIKNTQLGVDIMDIQDMTNAVNLRGLNMTNALVECKNNDEKPTVKHILEVPILKSKLKWDTLDAEKEREWVLSKISAKKYCDTDGLREKDRLYFQNNGWTRISPCECLSHGMNVTNPTVTNPRLFSNDSIDSYY